MTAAINPTDAIATIKTDLENNAQPEKEPAEIRAVIRQYLAPMIELCSVGDIVDALVEGIDEQKPICNDHAVTALKLAADISPCQ